LVVVPNPHFPPDDEALAQADVVLDSIDKVWPETIVPG